MGSKMIIINLTSGCTLLNQFEASSAIQKDTRGPSCQKQHLFIMKAYNNCSIKEKKMTAKIELLLGISKVNKTESFMKIFRIALHKMLSISQQFNWRFDDFAVCH